jgi:hypothetical protein
MLVLGALVALLFVGPSWAADQAAPATGDKPATAAKKERADPRGPLPAYYRNVIDGAQREKAYKIFDEYEPKIDELKAQLKALVAKRDAEVEALLTAEQKSRIKELAAEAKAKRDAAGKKDAKPAATSTTEAAK